MRLFNKIILVVVFWLAIATPAYADAFSGNGDLQAILAMPELSVDGYELSKDELNSFYVLRGYHPVWDFSGHANSEAFAAFLDSITHLIDYHGLERDDYPIDMMRQLAGASDSESKTKLELMVSDTLLHLAHDLHGDYIDLAKLYPGWNFQRADTDIAAGLSAAITAGNLNDYMESLTPKNLAYKQLAQALQNYRGFAAVGEWPKIDPGPALHPNDNNPRVGELRLRLAAEGYLPPMTLLPEQANQFDDDLRKAVLAYQVRNGLETDGNVGAKAFEALNVPLAARIDQIRANMERWRHMPDDFPPDHYVLVNIPDASVIIVEDGKIIYHGHVIVGRVDRKTPFINSVIKSMIVNPSWHVPIKIARKDILPKLRKDPHYMEKLGIVIVGESDDPYGADIDWRSMRERDFDFKLRQEPGDQNSLGRLKFDFANDFAVYMHGTPHQELFKKFERTLSSGCVRLEEPEQVAQVFLSHNKGDWDIAKIEDAINSGKTRWIGLTQPMPIFIVYWSVFTDDSGAVNFRKDVYDYDRILMQDLKGEEQPDAPTSH